MVNNDMLIKYISGDLPLGDRRYVYEWIASSEENLSEYKALRRLYDISLWKVPMNKVRRRTVARRIITAAAAFAAIAVVAFIMFSVGRDSSPMPPLYLRSVTAPPGKELCMTLDDGTLVWLNSNSTLTIGDDEGDGVRRVQLEGEGYFKVAHDRTRPFIVHAAGLGVKVLGTEFNVKSYKDKGIWETALLDGSVAILDKNEKEILTIVPGTMVSYADSKLVASTLKKENYLWKDGVLFFDDMTLREILAYVSEYYDVSIDVPESPVFNKRYTGKFKSLDGYAHILKVLKTDSGFKYSIRHESGAAKITISV